ncbi:hypothetical protein CYMTET_14029 [Cymbomonas tetramitiformis]|uniref:Uncharacterized protein n=1 Tax=Cymbomonas tetramitiformis TaxID=36881 RepID=A0AAE0GH85_9CHLO|nr:hypothetical protein CYMTET_14029 [Cymbomonas tetramitiformis]
MEAEALVETPDFEPEANDDDEVEIITGSVLGAVAIVALLTFGLLQYRRTQESSSGDAKPSIKKVRSKNISSSGTGRVRSSSGDGDMEAGAPRSATYDNPLAGMGVCMGCREEVAGHNKGGMWVQEETAWHWEGVVGVCMRDGVREEVAGYDEGL